MILNLLNNKSYIGSTKNFSSRKAQHFRSLKNNKHHSYHLQNSFNKYKIECFSFLILERIEDLSLLIDRELHWVKLKDTLNPNKGYNIAIPKKDCSLTLRTSTIDKLKLGAYNQYYKDNKRISLKDFMNGKRSKDLIIKKGTEHLKKKLLLFDKMTGEKKLSFNSIQEASLFFCIDYKKLFQFIDKDNKTYKGYIIVREENYDKSKIYKKIYKPKKFYIKKTVEEKEQNKFRGYPIKATNIKTGESITYNNKSDLAEKMNTNKKYIDRVMYGKRNHHKGFTFEFIR